MKKNFYFVRSHDKSGIDIYPSEMEKWPVVLKTQGHLLPRGIAWCLTVDIHLFILMVNHFFTTFKR